MSKEDILDEENSSIRPLKLNEYIGQEQLKNNLKVYISAAKKRNESLDHILFYGPPGLGKTTLANIIANEMGVNLIVVSGPSIEKTGDLAAILTNINAGDIIFIDEIHRIPMVVEESLYSALEDYTLSIIINRETVAKTLTINLPPFTLIGATTRIGNISMPFQARFGIVEKFDFYSPNDLAKIVMRTANIFGFNIEKDACLEIAKRSRGTPRLANRILKRVRDFATYKNRKIITSDDAKNALKALNIDPLGLDEINRRYLETLIKRFSGGPVGLDTLASTLGEVSTNLEDVYEPYLLKLELIDRTPKGRVATKKAYKYLNIEK